MLSPTLLGAVSLPLSIDTASRHASALTPSTIALSTFIDLANRRRRHARLPSDPRTTKPRGELLSPSMLFSGLPRSALMRLVQAADPGATFDVQVPIGKSVGGLVELRLTSGYVPAVRHCRLAFGELTDC